MKCGPVHNCDRLCRSCSVAVLIFCFEQTSAMFLIKFSGGCHSPTVYGNREVRYVLIRDRCHRSSKTGIVFGVLLRIFELLEPLACLNFYSVFGSQRRPVTFAFMQHILLFILKT